MRTLWGFVLCQPVAGRVLYVHDGLEIGSTAHRSLVRKWSLGTASAESLSSWTSWCPPGQVRWDLAQPQMGWPSTLSLSPRHMGQRYEAIFVLSPFLGLTFSCSISTIDEQELQSEKYGFCLLQQAPVGPLPLQAKPMDPTAAHRH